MWDRLQEQVALERDQLRRLLEIHRPLVNKCVVNPPDDIELSALAAMLHSFYNGVENILKRLTVEFGDSLPGSEFWHKELLDAMTQPTGRRTPVLSARLGGRVGTA